ncbi:MAG: hypothetical protein EA419_04535 [Wenzhouxiangella sp.]|nr:MAG: hypothetical protein EA419_04535 [Wenzhouxiangella sp.]
MMQLTEHKPGNHHAIRSASSSHVVVDNEHFSSSLIVGARLLEADWPVFDLADLNETTLKPLIEHQPELVVLGCGEQARFPPVAIQRLFFERGIGLECMGLTAACRTFNVLMSENRRAIAGLILNQTGQDPA